MFVFVKTTATPTLTKLAQVHESLSAALSRVDASLSNAAQVRSEALLSARDLLWFEMLNAGKVKQDRDAAIADKQAEYASSQLEFAVAREELFKSIAAAQRELSGLHFAAEVDDAGACDKWHRMTTLNNYSVCAQLLQSAVLKLNEVNALRADVCDNSYALCTLEPHVFNDSYGVLYAVGRTWSSWLASLPAIDEALDDKSRALLCQCLALVAGCEHRISSINGAPCFDVIVTGIAADVIEKVVALFEEREWEVGKVLSCSNAYSSPYLRLYPPKGRQALPPKQYKRPDKHVWVRGRNFGGL
jgi:hypothetical protein